MNTFILIDTANLFFRSRHTIKGDIDLKIGMSLHITLNSIRKAWRDFGGTHIVFLSEGRSWRKDFYEPYKRNRIVDKSTLTQRELTDDETFWEAFDIFKNFIIQQTNCSFLRHSQLEADDLIAGFIQGHPNDNHVIISTDSDFYQLIAPNVQIYNGVSETTISLNGFVDAKGKTVIDSKTKKPKLPPNPEWILFEKCIRGDSTDNIFSAYPKVRKTKLEEAFADRSTQGYAWNNLMLQRYAHHDGTEHRVCDDYQRNVTLIDLSAQPDNIKVLIKETIAGVAPKDISQVGIRVLKFCHLYDLQRISDQVQSYSDPLNQPYPVI